MKKSRKKKRVRVSRDIKKTRKKWDFRNTIQYKIIKILVVVLIILIIIYAIIQVYGKKEDKKRFEEEGELRSIGILSTTISGCQTLDVENESYELNQDIVQGANSNCFDIIAQNITLDCKGYSITSIYNRTGVYSDQFNTTVKNCDISMGGAGYGVFFQGAYNSTIYNCILNEQARGLYLMEVNSTIIKDVIANNNTFGFSVLHRSDNNFFWNITTNNNTNGFYIYNSSDNIIRGLEAYYNAWAGVYLRINASYNVLEKVMTNYNAVHGIRMHINSSDNIVLDSDFGDDNVRMSHISVNNSFINCSYVSETVDLNCGLLRKWYYQAYVNGTNGSDLGGVKIMAYNVSGCYMFNLTTDSGGHTEMVEIIDYENVDGNKIYYSNYLINASFENESSAHEYNVTERGGDFMDFFTIFINDTNVSVNHAPEFDRGDCDDLVWDMNVDYELNLDDCFEDADDDDLEYRFVNRSSNLDIQRSSDVLTLVPRTDWIGTGFFYIYANDSIEETRGRVDFLIEDVSSDDDDDDLPGDDDDDVTDDDDVIGDDDDNVFRIINPRPSASLITIFTGDNKTFSIDNYDYDSIKWFFDGKLVSIDLNSFEVSDLSIGNYTVKVEVIKGSETIGRAWNLIVEETEEGRVRVFELGTVIFWAIIAILVIIIMLVVWLLLIEKTQKKERIDLGFGVTGGSGGAGGRRRGHSTSSFFNIPNEGH